MTWPSVFARAENASRFVLSSEAPHLPTHVVKSGDSSAPVFVQLGILHGMVSAKFIALEVGIVIVFSEITNAAIKNIGMDLELA